MKNEFNKLTSGSLDKDDFDASPDKKLPFLMRINAALDPVPNGVTVNSEFNGFCTVVTTYQGLKELDKHPAVVTIDYSRPGGTI